MPGLYGIITQMTETVGPLPRRWLDTKSLGYAVSVQEDARLPENGTGDFSLSARVHKIGKWWKWCYWSPEERKKD